MSSFGIWHWLILAAIVLWIWWALKRTPKRTTAETPRGGPFARIRGTGNYSVEVVGESHYAPAFKAMIRTLRVSDIEGESFGDALLKLEDSNQHDKNAVSVHIEGHQVGYLSRAMAVDFRKALVRDGLSGRKEFSVGARVYWGGDEKHHSVTLDIPQS